MPVIKRYPNRKLYDTESKKYVTLNGIAEVIREGEDVQVIDHATGDDLTALTLTQIIFEQEKRQGGFLPRSVLTGLVQAGGDQLSALRRSLSSPLDLFRHVDEEIARRIRVLVNRGDLDEDAGHSLLQQLLALGQRSSDNASDVEQADVERVLNERGVPSGEDIRRLESQLEQLAAKLEEMSQDAS